MSTVWPTILNLIVLASAKSESALAFLARSRAASARDLAVRTALYCAESLTACVSRASTIVALAVWLMKSSTISAPETPAAATAPSMYLSVIFAVTPASHWAGWNSSFSPEPDVALARFFFLASPGRRLISIIFCYAPGLILAKGQADGEHQERRDLVGHQRLQRSFAHRHRGERIRELYGLLQPLPQRFGKTWRA